MSETVSAAEVVRPPLQLVRLPVDKPGPAVAFLQARSRGVMDLIAHFWERLAHTPPLQRADLHLVAATPITSDNVNINIPQLDWAGFSGAMLYVPKAHRADVLALDPPTAAAFAAYIGHHGSKAVREHAAAATETAPAAPGAAGTGPTLPVTDLSVAKEDHTSLPAEPPPAKSATNGRAAIDFLTGDAEGIGWMTPLLLPLVHKRHPARQLVNVVMQLPAEVGTQANVNVRLARDADIPTLNRWRRLYKEERGILFDADMDAWVQGQRVFVYEAAVEAKEGSGAAAVNETNGGGKAVVAIAKIDLDLASLVEIGGVYTFPEYRNHGYGAGIVRHLAWHIRQQGKVPTLQVDEQNQVALRLYQTAGWREMGRLARVWLTG